MVFQAFLGGLCAEPPRGTFVFSASAHLPLSCYTTCHVQVQPEGGIRGLKERQLKGDTEWKSLRTCFVRLLKDTWAFKKRHIFLLYVNNNLVNFVTLSILQIDPRWRLLSSSWYPPVHLAVVKIEVKPSSAGSLGVIALHWQGTQRGSELTHLSTGSISRWQAINQSVNVQAGGWMTKSSLSDQFATN